MIPAFLEMEFAVAVGMRGASESEWRDYQNMFARSTSHLLFENISGYEGTCNFGNQLFIGHDLAYALI